MKFNELARTKMWHHHSQPLHPQNRQGQPSASSPWSHLQKNSSTASQEILEYRSVEWLRDLRSWVRRIARIPLGSPYPRFEPTVSSLRVPEWYRVSLFTASPLSSITNRILPISLKLNDGNWQEKALPCGVLESVYNCSSLQIKLL